MHINVMPKTIVLPWLGQIHFSSLVCFCVVLILCFLCILISRSVKNSWKEVPGRLQWIIESAVGGLRDYARKNGDRAGDDMGPYVLAVAMLVSTNCLVELFSFTPPTSDLSMTLMMGLMTLIVVNVMGIKHRKLSGRLHFYVEPTPVVAPFKLIGDMAMPISLSCRLYGNILSGVIVMHMIYAVVPVVVPAALSIYFSLFHTLIQTYVFVTLTLNYVKEAVEVGH